MRHSLAMTEVAFRLAAWDTPWWVNPNRSQGRFNRVGQTTQYLSLHPLGPWAELIRRDRLFSSEDLATLRQRVWAARIELTSAVEITWDNSKSEFGIKPDELVADDQEPCRELADRLRQQGVATLIVPSAALPGTRNVVLFGPRITAPYSPVPIDVDLDVPTSLVAEGAQIHPEILGMVRRSGETHVGLEAWRAGELEPRP